MSKEENIKSFDSYCEEIAEFSNLVKNGTYEGWEFEGSGEFDIEQIENVFKINFFACFKLPHWFADISAMKKGLLFINFFMIF